MSEILSSPVSPSADLSIESAEDALGPLIDTESLTSIDIRSDPILASLAKRQARTASATPTAASPNVGFKARPAPNTTRAEGLGPRMTKSAALRQGLKWDEAPKRPARPVSIQAAPKGFEAVPGHKRSAHSISIASLAAPTILPRSTKSSQLRTGESTVGTPVKRDMAAIAAANRAKADQEKAKRRASVALPSSLSAPQIAPRMNRSAELRAGGPPNPTERTNPPSSFPRSHSALTATSSINVAPNPVQETPSKDEKAKRRASVIGAVKSLGTPSIQPRMNRSAMLRAPASSSGTIPTTASLASLAATPPRPKMTSVPSHSSTSVQSLKTDAKLPQSPGPRPTKSSLLRANMGAKVLSR